MADKNKKHKKERSARKPKWRRVLKKIHDKSKERWKQFTTATTGQLFQNWGTKHHLPSSAQVDASALLQQQLEQYQAEIEHRKHRSPGEDEGDDVLPYQQEALSMEWVNQLQPAVEPSSEEDQSYVSAEPTVHSEAATASSPTTSTSSSSESDKTSHLNLLLMDMMTDAQKPEQIRKEEEDNLLLPPPRLPMMSRLESDKFDRIVEENTKQSLFLSQPNYEDRQHWEEHRARMHHTKPAAHTVHIVTENVESRKFCTSCVPRHPKYPYMKLTEAELRKKT